MDNAWEVTVKGGGDFLVFCPEGRVGLEKTYGILVELSIIIHNDIRILRRSWLQKYVMKGPAATRSKAHDGDEVATQVVQIRELCSLLARCSGAEKKWKVPMAEKNRHPIPSGEPAYQLCTQKLAAKSLWI